MSVIDITLSIIVDLLSGNIMMLVLVVVGVYMGYKINFIYLRHFTHVFRKSMVGLFNRSGTKKGALTPFQSLTTALAGTIGTGNIAGVAGAITLGGPGAVFWMWVAAAIGMGTKYAEIVLAVYYREKNIKGEWVGGPMYYIKNGLSEKSHSLATLFCIFGCIAAIGTGNMIQANTVANSFAVALSAVNIHVVKVICGILLMAVIAFVVIGGAKRVGGMTEKIVPVMAILYIVATAIIIFSNLDRIIPITKMIVICAFNPQAVFGAGFGITILYALRYGVGRGVFSNEAGLGSAPIAHGSADTKSPVKQGFLGIIEVFIDTVVICTLTAYTILISGVSIPYGRDIGAELTATAFTKFYGTTAPKILALAIALFALSSMISWSFYGLRCFEMLFKGRYIFIYKLLFVVAIIPACLMDVGMIWNTAGLLNGLMTAPNLIALVLLSGKVGELTKEYFNGIKDTITE